MSKVSRLPVFDFYAPIHVTCPKCGKHHTLYFNGGELDKVECCGIVWCTEIKAVDLVMIEPE